MARARTKHIRPNQSLEPMARSVTPSACAEVEPALTMAHHQTLAFMSRNSLALAFALELCVIHAASGAEITILQGQKFRFPVRHGLPVPAHDRGITIQAAAFMLDEKTLSYAFLFQDEKSAGLTSVTVEDVTGQTPNLLISDSGPVEDHNLWKGTAKPLPLSPSAVAWAFESGSSTRVYRFTIRRKGESAPITIYQASIFGPDIKKLIQDRAHAQQG